MWNRDVFLFFCCFCILFVGTVVEGGTCLDCVKQKKRFCAGTSTRVALHPHNLKRLIPFTEKKKGPKTEQCKGEMYVHGHRCDTEWCSEERCCSEYVPEQSTTSEAVRLAMAEKTTWTQAEAKAAGLRVVKTAFTAVMLAGSVGAVSVGGPCRFKKDAISYSLSLSLFLTRARTITLAHSISYRGERMQLSWPVWRHFGCCTFSRCALRKTLVGPYVPFCAHGETLAYYTQERLRVHREKDAPNGTGQVTGQPQET